MTTKPTIKRRAFDRDATTGEWGWITRHDPIAEDTCSNTENPYCPHCGEEVTDPWELGLEDGDIAEIECGECGGSLNIEASVTVTFTTKPVGGWKEATE